MALAATSLKVSESREKPLVVIGGVRRARSRPDRLDEVAVDDGFEPLRMTRFSSDELKDLGITRPALIRFYAPPRLVPRRSIAAATKSRNRGWAFVGLDLNSG